MAKSKAIIKNPTYQEMSPAPLATMTFTPSKEHNQNAMREPMSGFNMKEIQT